MQLNHLETSTRLFALIGLCGSSQSNAALRTSCQDRVPDRMLRPAWRQLTE